MEAFLVRFSQTSHPRLASYKTFATVYSVFKSDKSWLQTKPTKRQITIDRNRSIEAQRNPPPPLIWVFGNFRLFLHHGIEKVERHLLWKFHKKIQRKNWSNVPPKFLACLRFLHKVVHKTFVSENSIAPRRLNLIFYRLDYLYETWHTCSSCSWLQNNASNYFNFCLGT